MCWSSIYSESALYRYRVTTMAQSYDMFLFCNTKNNIVNTVVVPAPHQVTVKVNEITTLFQGGKVEIPFNGLKTLSSFS